MGNSLGQLTATNIADLENWCGVVLIVLIVAVCYTVIRVKKGYPPVNECAEKDDE